MTLNKIELQNLRKLINNQNIFYNKLINYADYAVDPQIKQIFNETAKESLIIKEKLSIFIKSN